MHAPDLPLNPSEIWALPEEALLPDILINMKGEIVFLFDYRLPNEIWSIVIDMVYPAYPPSSYPVLNRVCKAWYQITQMGKGKESISISFHYYYYHLNFSNYKYL